MQRRLRAGELPVGDVAGAGRQPATPSESPRGQQWSAVFIDWKPPFPSALCGLLPPRRTGLAKTLRLPPAGRIRRGMPCQHRLSRRCWLLQSILVLTSAKALLVKCPGLRLRRAPLGTRWQGWACRNRPFSCRCFSLLVVALPFILRNRVPKSANVTFFEEER